MNVEIPIGAQNVHALDEVSDMLPRRVTLGMTGAIRDVRHRQHCLFEGRIAEVDNHQLRTDLAIRHLAQNIACGGLCVIPGDNSRGELDAKIC
jgi:hypothetical protein